MPITATSNLTNPGLPRPDCSRTSTQRLDGDAKGDQLRQRVNEFVGLFFYGTLLKGSRENRLTRSQFGFGGRGEQAFGAQLDQELAQRAGQAGDNELSEAIFRELSGKRASGITNRTSAEDVLSRPRAAGAYAERAVAGRKLDVVR